MSARRNTYRPFSALVLCVLVVSATGCSKKDSEALGKAFQPAADLFSKVSATKVKPTEIFCGNIVQPVFNPANGVGGARVQPAPVCRSPATGAVAKLVEVRGWDVSDAGDAFGHLGGSDTDDDNNIDKNDHQGNEFLFDLRLDLNWSPAPNLPSNITPINSLKELSAALTPRNVIQLTPAAPLDRSGFVWGGAAAVGIHVELNNWYSRGRMHGRGNPPADWTSGDPSEPWPYHFPPSINNLTTPDSEMLTHGKYVRLVGLLWEDTPHGIDDNVFPSAAEALDCWGSGASEERGHAEIHPADYMAMLPDPHTDPSGDGDPEWRGDRVEVIAICRDDGPVHFTRKIAPTRFPPQSSVFQPEVCFERAATHFTNHTGATVTVSKTPNKDAIVVDVDLRTVSGSYYKYMEFFRVFWLRKGETCPV